jgi:hypothetical protein
MKEIGMFSVLRVPGLVLVSLLGLGLATSNAASPAVAGSPPASRPSGAAAKQQDFDTAEAAADALFKASQANDVAALRAIFGPAGEKLVVSGDPVADSAVRKRFVDAYTASHTLTPADGGRMVLVVGTNAWPLPIPLIQVGGRWRFDSAQGAQDIVDRRIGRNELMTIHTLLALVAAQQDYFDRVQRGAGSGAYAQRFLSTRGKQDGLYWDAAAGEAASPLAPLIEQVESEGYPGATATNGKQTPYQGYFYRMLKAQGPDAAGGPKDYVRNGRAAEGFAFVAWPAVYGTAGMVTFVVDQDGIVFQEDLGQDTAKIAAGMTRFDPDFTWTRVDISD